MTYARQPRAVAPQRLTEFEVAILRLLRVGRTNREIAEELSTTVSAITPEYQQR